MSKTIKIPTSMNPFVVIVNGVKHEYPAGETVEVPDHIAAIIEQHEKGSFPKPALPATEINMVSPSGKRFKVTVSDEGELAVKNGDNMLTFKIDGRIFTAEEGMTWAEWVASEYVPTKKCYICNKDIPAFAVNGDTISSVGNCQDCEENDFVLSLVVYETEEARENRDLEHGAYIEPGDVIDPDKFYGEDE